MPTPPPGDMESVPQVERAAHDVLSSAEVSRQTREMLLASVRTACERTQQNVYPPHYRRVIVIVPAHNEVDQISDTLRAIMRQTRLPDEVHVSIDNSPDDRLAAVASAFPVVIHYTHDNTHKKAGNLNQFLTPRLSDTGTHLLDDRDVVMGFDADSVPGDHFIENALHWVSTGYDAVGATFLGRRGGGILGQLQRTEFARFARHQSRRQRCDVLSGTGWAITVSALRQVMAMRPSGQVYDHSSTVEDYELTLMLQSLGVLAIAPVDCLVHTDVMETWRDWVSQRLRWQYGTLDELIRYGWTKNTREMITRQIMTYLFALMTPLTILYLWWSYYLFGWKGLNPLNAPLYLSGIVIVIVEQSWQARKAGWNAVFMSLLAVPDYVYSLTRQYVYARALYRIARRKKPSSWGAGTDI